MNAPFRPGTHLITDRTVYTHHGIYVGDGRVVHYAGLANGWESGPVEEVSLEQFANGERVFASAHSSRSFSSAEIVARARSRLGENMYDLFRNNCEHFSQWCVTGRRRSWQVGKWLSLPTRLLRTVFSMVRRCMGAVASFRVPLEQQQVAMDRTYREGPEVTDHRTPGTSKDGGFTFYGEISK